MSVRKGLVEYGSKLLSGFMTCFIYGTESKNITLFKYYNYCVLEWFSCVSQEVETQKLKQNRKTVQ